MSSVAEEGRAVHPSHGSAGVWEGSGRRSPGPSSWPRSRRNTRAGAGSQSPQPRPCSSGRSPLSWIGSGRRSRSARGARPTLHVHVCGPFLLPIFRWGIDSSSSFALSVWEGDRHGSQEEETHPAPLSTSAEGLAVKGVIMGRSGQTAVAREADEGRC